MKKKLLLLLGIIIAVAGVFVWDTIAEMREAVPKQFAKVAAAVAPPEPTTVAAPALVEALEHKLELTVAEAIFTTSVSTGTCGESGWQVFAWNDCLTMEVPGKVEVDVDLGGFDLEDIEETPEQVIITLPGVVVGDIVINHATIRVVGYDDGVFVWSPNPNLQGEGLAKATKQIRDQACRSDKLRTEAVLKAEENIHKLLRPIFKAAGDRRTLVVQLTSVGC